MNDIKIESKNMNTTELKHLIIRLCKEEMKRQSLIKKEFLTKCIKESRLNNDEKLVIPPSKLTRSINYLKPAYKEIIINEFYKPKSDKYWYEDKYCRATFYKYRNEAMKDLVNIYVSS
ncbi:MG284/MPN403 family protein [Mycoplasmopsis opalescens]|uniref:MG284/MPN403 family protein n=1 Tax=Mycoplasmopsis opalescens TaxID=114886 RepID=UPI0004A6FC10|nr:hypothetical protein [Mycoplasmopsis opalescens]